MNRGGVIAIDHAHARESNQRSTSRTRNSVEEEAMPINMEGRSKGYANSGSWYAHFTGRCDKLRSEPAMASVSPGRPQENRTRE